MSDEKTFGRLTWDQDKSTSLLLLRVLLIDGHRLACCIVFLYKFYHSGTNEAMFSIYNYPHLFLISHIDNVTRNQDN